MMPDLSPNAQAILLLTAPLIVGRGSPSEDLLSPGEYKLIARRMREMQRQPADLLSPDAADLLRDCQLIIDQTRLRRLLARGFLLSQVIERWQARAIWVRSRADTDYPRRLKGRLREDAPAVLYGCGDINLLNTGGLAVVGSRDVDEILIDYTKDVSRLIAHAGKTLVSGGARGIDHAAMSSALEAGGRVVGVLSDSLERSALNRENREMLMGGRLVLISPYDPSAGFNIGNAMRRNKLIYALADVSLIVNSDFNKGGTWAGAIEQLNKFRVVPVYVRSTGESSEGIDALREKGAIPWPNPQDANALEDMFHTPVQTVAGAVPVGDSLPFYNVGSVSDPGITPSAALVPRDAAELPPPVLDVHEVPYMAEDIDKSQKPTPEPATRPQDSHSSAGSPPADVLFAVVREVLRHLLIVPMKDVDVASALEVTTTQAKTWLQRLVDEGVLEGKKKPRTYITNQSRLL
jgi:DNA processing protein